jgi:hypothetical protein
MRTVTSRYTIFKFCFASSTFFEVKFTECKMKMKKKKKGKSSEMSTYAVSNFCFLAVRLSLSPVFII